MLLIFLLFRRLFIRDSCVDLEFVCRDGIVKCHKMVVAAHSSFIRNILLGCGDDDSVCQIRLPDFTKSSVECLMEYLYKGRLEAPTSQKAVLRDLFVDILKIDPAFGSASASPGNVQSQSAIIAVKPNNLKVRALFLKSFSRVAGPGSVGCDSSSWNGVAWMDN